MKFEELEVELSPFGQSMKSIFKYAFNGNLEISRGKFNILVTTNTAIISANLPHESSSLNHRQIFSRTSFLTLSLEKKELTFIK